LIDFAAEHEYLLRFIELMPFCRNGAFARDQFLPVGEVRRQIQARTEMVADDGQHGNGPAVYYHLPRYGVTVGFIAPLTQQHFCARCNKLRLTADGKIRPCLGAPVEFDLKPALRGTRPRAEAVREILAEALAQKPANHRFGSPYPMDRIMCAVGG
jgi:cyclic pyranopterin phosphate synthase